AAHAAPSDSPLTLDTLNKLALPRPVWGRVVFSRLMLLEPDAVAAQLRGPGGLAGVLERILANGRPAWDGKKLPDLLAKFHADLRSVPRAGWLTEKSVVLPSF